MWASHSWQSRVITHPDLSGPGTEDDELSMSMRSNGMRDLPPGLTGQSKSDQKQSGEASGVNPEKYRSPDDELSPEASPTLSHSDAYPII